jgi:hypothetical protein
MHKRSAWKVVAERRGILRLMRIAPAFEEGSPSIDITGPSLLMKIQAAKSCARSLAPVDSADE